MKVRTPLHGDAAVERFDFPAFLTSVGVGGAATAIHYKGGDAIFTQGDPCTDVQYVETGSVKLSVVSKTGREAVVGLLGPGDFFGEACLTDMALRRGSATAIMSSTIWSIPRKKMADLLRKEPKMADGFIAYVLARNLRVEEDLIDQLFNSTEKRLARALLLLSGYGTQDKPAGAAPAISQDTLAEMIGATRPRVNYFLKKFKRLGFIDYDRKLPPTINRSLLSVLLHD